LRDRAFDSLNQEDSVAAIAQPDGVEAQRLRRVCAEPGDEARAAALEAALIDGDECLPGTEFGEFMGLA
jgi:hypothetical protein